MTLIVHFGSGAQMHRLSSAFDGTPPSVSHNGASKSSAILLFLATCMRRRARMDEQLEIDIKFGTDCRRLVR